MDNQYSEAGPKREGRSAILAQALGYIRSDIQVFPVGADKTPVTAHGFKDATTDEAIICRWFTEHPDWNLALEPEQAGWLVVDLDIKDGKNGMATWAALCAERDDVPDTYTVETPNGGRHLYFAGSGPTTGPKSTNRLGEGIDTRGIGGYVLLPPSRALRDDGTIGSYRVVSNAPVAPLPEFVSAHLATQHERREAPDGIEPGAPHVIERGRRYLRGVIAQGGAPVTGSRNDQCTRLADRLGDFGCNADDATMLLEEEWAPHGTAPDEAIADIVASAYRSRQNAIGCDYKPADAEGDDDVPANVFRVCADPCQVWPPRRLIEVKPNSLDYAVDHGEAALIEQGVSLFQRGDMLVRPGDMQIEVRGGEAMAPRLYPVSATELREHLTKAGRWRKYYADGRAVEANCPDEIAAVYVERKGRWKLPHLDNIITAPTMRADGTILTAPGYDAEARLLYLPQPGLVLPPIPASPTHDDAFTAMAVLGRLISTFQFGTREHRAVALSAFLTAAIRPSLPLAPMFGFSAPVRGAGKGLLADTIAMVATGRRAATMVPGSEEETEKRLSSLLMRADPIILLDNCTDPVGGKFMNAMMTTPRIQVRVLGLSKVVELPTSVTMFATGNNLEVAADQTRRVLISVLDPECEHPERRPFNNDPVKDAERDRGRYLMAALTILRAFTVAGRPQQATPLGSFENWSHTVRDALLWLGEADPVATQREAEEKDPERELLQALLHSWAAVVGPAKMTAKQVLELVSPTAANPHPDTGKLVEALQYVAPSAERFGPRIDARALGRYLAKHEKRIIDGFWLRRAIKDGNTTWQVIAKPA